MRIFDVAICCATVAAAFLSSDVIIRAADAPVVSATPTPDADAIFLRAASVTRALPEPNFAVYDLTTREDGMTLEKKRDQDGSVTSYFYWNRSSDVKHFHVSYRVFDDMALMVDADSGQRTLGAALPVPVLSVTALSPINKAARTASGTANTPPPAVSPSGNVAEKVMGEISVDASRSYKVTLAGVGDEDGRSTFHLLLRARTDPKTHPLSDLYVDATTFRILRAVAEYATSVVIDGYKCTVSIDFASAGPYWIVTDGTIEGTAHVFFQHVSGSYTFTVENPTFPATLPQSDFVAAATPSTTR